MIDNRCSLVLNNQEKICINGKEYLIKEEIGRGASCICYTSTSCENGLNYIIKEFYPLTCAKRTVDMKIVAKDGSADEFLQCKKRFEKLYENNLSIQKAHKNLFVEPNYELSGNGYIVMPARDLCTLSEWVTENIPQDSANNTVIDGYLNNALNILHSVAEQLEIYQNNNIIHFDIKPDNIFVFEENNGYFARIIDFDSMMTFSEIEELLDKNQLLKLYSTANCYGEETRASFYAKLKDGFSEKWKQLDVYPLGRLCTFILTGNKILDIDDFTEDSSFLVSNKSETVNIRKYVFDRFIDKLTAGFGNRYSNAATVKFVVENLQTFMSCYGYFDNQLKYRKDIVSDLLCNKIVYETKGALSPLENLIKSENIFENKQSLLLLAECGMGKSTALRKLYLDAILFNQSKYRFVYYPLRECGSEKQAKNLEKDVFATNLIDKNNAVVLLDAFDESEGNDGGDCREELTARINAICETNSVILTSRIEVKGLQTAKKVTCKPKDFSDSELLKRIQENSPWVKSLHGDILANPLYVIMAESVKRIDDYAQEEKEIGTTCWNLIKEHLIGEIYEDEHGKKQLKINYAGELIYNYIHLSVLTQFKSKREVFSAIEGLQNIGKWKNRESGRWLQLLGNQPFFSMHRVKNKKRIIGNSVIANLYLLTMDNTLNFTKSVVYNQFGTTWIGERNIDEWCETNWDKNFPVNYGIEECEFLSEICGCKYNSNLRLSEFQEHRRYNLQKCIDIFKRYQKGKRHFERWLYPLFWGNSKITNLDFSGLDLSGIKVFRSLENCNFDNCKLFAVCGDFKNCSFLNLQSESFVSSSIEKGYSYCENNNELTLDKKTLVFVNNFDKHTSFAKLSAETINKIERVVINAFSKIKPNRIIIPSSVIDVEAYNGSLVAENIVISGKTKLVNFCEDTSLHHRRRMYFENLQRTVRNIWFNYSHRYIECKGCIYSRKRLEKSLPKYTDEYHYRLLWINQIREIIFLPRIQIDCYERISFIRDDPCLWEKVTLPESVIMLDIDNHGNSIVTFLRFLLRDANRLTSIKGLPIGFSKINGFIVLDSDIFGDLNTIKELLYLPPQILMRCSGIIERYEKIYIPVNEMDLYNPCVKITQEYLDQASRDESFTQERNKSYIRNQLKTKLITWEEMSDTQKKVILRQQKEWDKYLNN